LEWWKKLDKEHRLAIEDLRDFAGAALAAGELATASTQIDQLLAQRGGTAPIDILLAGQLAVRRSDAVLALDYAERVMADKRAKPYEVLSAAILALSVTKPESPPYAVAWKRIEDLARDRGNAASLNALVFLSREEAGRPITAFGGNPSLSLGTTPRQTTAPQPAAALSPPPEVPTDSTSQSTPEMQSGDTVTLNLAATPPPVPAGRTMSLTEVADALENHPDARPVHKLLALEVRARRDPALTNQYVADAVGRFGNGDDETVATLAGWLNKIGRPAKTLEVLPEARAIQRQDFFLQYVNALAALQRWSEVKDLSLSEHSVVDPMIQHMYLAVAQAHLGSAIGATNEWRRALETANTPEKLLTLATNAEQNSADIADAAYSEAIKTAPTNRAAYTGRLRLALARGKTAQAQTIAAEIAQMWPDEAARNQDAYLRLLLGASGGTAEAAEREADILVRKEPRNWSARATLGLACLRLGRNKDALAAIRQPPVTGIEPPGALAVRAAILAANGYDDGARNDARLLSAKPLLPEERALIAPLLQ
jgi:tetratricopeptide (TPR) repeat protein